MSIQQQPLIEIILLILNIDSLRGLEQSCGKKKFQISFSSKCQISGR